jgi:hypothetical protein
MIGVEKDRINRGGQRLKGREHLMQWHTTFGINANESVHAAPININQPGHIKGVALLDTQTPIISALITRQP